jgi:peptide/nickel transport system ATP-binding protein/oligopeptide transport system ATP-binding protein
LLDVQNLRVGFGRGAAHRQVVHGVSLALAPGEILGLIGESGSGKTVTGLSLLRLLSSTARLAADRLAFDGMDLLAMPDGKFAALRGRHLAMIFQDPAGAFNPAKPIGWHIATALRMAAIPLGDHGEALLAQVGIANPARVLRLYPHQLSGGMLQRALIAMVIALRPRLIVADEPTTNLDNIVERQILALIAQHCRAIGAAVLFITHDLTIARDICDRIAVLYAGEIVETGSAGEILETPAHPYTDGLLRTVRSLDDQEARLFEIPGELAHSTRSERPGCWFAPRCARVMPRCHDRHPPLYDLGGGRSARCFLHER